MHHENSDIHIFQFWKWKQLKNLRATMLNRAVGACVWALLDSVPAEPSLDGSIHSRRL